MSDTMSTHGQGSAQPVSAPSVAAPLEVVRELERLRKQVAYLEACLVKANAQRDEVAQKLAEEHSLSEGYRRAVQALMAEDGTMTQEEFDAAVKDGRPFSEAIEHLENLVKEHPHD